MILQVHTEGRTAGGKAYQNEYITALRFKEGKAVHLKTMMDSLYASRAFPAMGETLRAHSEQSPGGDADKC